MASTVPYEANFASTLGAAYLGSIFSAIFYGLTTMQTFTYFRSASRDGGLFWMLIAGIWLLDTLHVVMVTHGIYYYVIVNFANPVAILSPIWSLLVQVYVTCIVILLVRCVFATRIWILSYRKKYLFGVIILLSLFAAGTGCAFASKGFGGTFAELFKHNWLLYAALGGAVVVDLAIAFTLCHLLIRNRTGFKKTDSVVVTLVVYTINTGLLTSICAAACFITYAIWPEQFIFMGIYFSLGKLYVNSLLASLNAREHLVNEHNTNPNVFSTSQSSSGFINGFGRPIYTQRGLSTHDTVTSQLPINVYIDQETDIEMK